MGFCNRRTTTRHVESLQSGQYHFATLVLQSVAPLAGYTLRLGLVRVQHLGPLVEVFRSVIKIQDHRLHTRKIPTQPILQSRSTIGDRHPTLGLVHSHLSTLISQWFAQCRQTTHQAAHVPHTTFFACIPHHPHRWHPTRCRTPLLALHPDTRQIRRHVRHRLPLTILRPLPKLFWSECL